ncbi:hypothetical protein AVEN_208850-1 [Araneus ventricosus]|uniref:Uncharacterized protein n=1 Tax=Araneus ventricosus TaxID=182803 RepID=A0A4Y2KLY4_ARAVE|nr:hypothetical protein AVEN_208850-1 [Araneus ventricosus]
MSGGVEQGGSWQWWRRARRQLAALATQLFNLQHEDCLINWGTSLGVTGFTTPRYPSGLISLQASPLLQLLLFAFLLPSLACRRGLSMRSCRRSVCFFLLMDSQKPHVLAVRGDPLDGWYTADHSASIGWYLAPFVVRLLGIKRIGHFLGLDVKGGHCPRG